MQPLTNIPDVEGLCVGFHAIVAAYVGGEEDAVLFLFVRAAVFLALNT